MQTTDLHMQILPYDYFADRETAGGSLSKIAEIVARLRCDATNALLFDTGDVLQGNPMADYVAFERPAQARRPHPIIAAMNAIGYDGATVGNHDFNYGVEFLQTTFSAARFPVVLSNLKPGRGSGHLFPPWQMLERGLRDDTGQTHLIRIGIIGFAPPQTAIRSNPRPDEALSSLDIVETARSAVPDMRAAGADLIVALAHSGIGPEHHVPGQENAAVPLAAVPGIDVVLAGHNHLPFPGSAYRATRNVDPRRGTLHGKPAVAGPAFGQGLGVIDLTLWRTHEAWKIAEFDCYIENASACETQPHPTTERPHRAPLPASVHSEHRSALAYVRRRVGHTEVPLNTFFSMVQPCQSLALVAAAQEQGVRKALVGSPYADLPVLSAVAPLKAGGRGGAGNFTDIAPGPITMSSIGDLYPYPDRLCAVIVEGRHLLEWLERSASVFNTFSSGSGARPLLDDRFPSYKFDVLHGVSYAIDLSSPARYGPDGALVDEAAHRVSSLRFQGAPVSPGMKFIVASNSYRAGGGSDVDGPAAVMEPQELMRNVLHDFFARHRVIHGGGLSEWRLFAPSGAVALFDTSPKALADRATLKRLDATPCGLTPEGLARLRLQLKPGPSQTCESLAATIDNAREVGAGKRLANPVRSGRKQP